MTSTASPTAFPLQDRSARPKDDGYNATSLFTFKISVQVQQDDIEV